MEVMCLNCKKMFSVDDNLYKGDWENFCSSDCRRTWLEEQSKKKDEEGKKSYIEASPFILTLEDKEDGE